MNVAELLEEGAEAYNPKIELEGIRTKLILGKDIDGSGAPGQEP